MSDIGLMVPGMHEPPSRYNVTITVAGEGGRLPDPVSFVAAADRAAWRRSASIVSAHTADQIISIVTVHAPGRYAAVAVARAVISDALKHQVPHPASTRRSPRQCGDSTTVGRLSQGPASVPRSRRTRDRRQAAGLAASAAAWRPGVPGPVAASPPARYLPVSGSRWAARRGPTCRLRAAACARNPARPGCSAAAAIGSPPPAFGGTSTQDPLSHWGFGRLNPPLAPASPAPARPRATWCVPPADTSTARPERSPASRLPQTGPQALNSHRDARA